MSLASCEPTFYPADLTVEIGDEDYDLVGQYREIEEISDRCIVSIIDSTVDSSKLGTYSVTFEIGNKKEVFQTVKCTVEVEDNTPPELGVTKEPTIYCWGEETSEQLTKMIEEQLRKCMIAHDNVDGDIDSSNIVIELSSSFKVDWDATVNPALGQHSATAYVKDSSGNISDKKSVPYIVTKSPYTLMAEGTTDGNNYKLLGSVVESYDSAKAAIGVMKNNEWLLEPTTDMPLTKDVLPDSLKRGKQAAVYVGNHTFCTGKTLYNCETKGEQTIKGPSSIKVLVKSGTETNIVPMYCDDFFYEYCIYFINTDDMSYSKLSSVNGKKFDYSTANDLGYYSEGLIFDKDNKWFFDKDGNVVLDMSDKFEYMRDKKDEPIMFVDGKASFYTSNDIGTEYKVTIDKSGNVVSNEKVAK